MYVFIEHNITELIGPQERMQKLLGSTGGGKLLFIYFLRVIIIFKARLRAQTFVTSR